MSDETERQAWEAYEREEYATAADLWEQLIRYASNETDGDRFRHGYGYALVGLKRFEEARVIYQQLFDKTGSHVFLHQLGMVARESGEHSKAAELFRHERSILRTDDSLPLAANLFEQGLVESLLGNQKSAIEIANRCLAVSMKTKDMVMHGCAYRLLGDLSRSEWPDMATSYYYKARKAFEEAGDKIACGEVDERLTEIT